MKRSLLVLGAAAATLFVASTAEAAHVSWSIGVNVAPVATYVSSGPAWVPAPARYVAPPVVYAPPPVVYEEPYVESYVVPSPAYYAAPVFVGPRYRHWAPVHAPHWSPRAPFAPHDRWHETSEHRR